MFSVRVFDEFCEISFSDFREELIFCIMMMDAVAEEYAFCVSHEVFEFFSLAVSIVRIKDSLVSLAHCEVVLEVLVSEDVTSAFSSFT